MTTIAEPRELLARADAATEKLDAARQSGSLFKIAAARREAEAVRAELQQHANVDQALAMFKTAQSGPRSLFEQSPGARLSKAAERDVRHGGILRKL